MRMVFVLLAAMALTLAGCANSPANQFQTDAAAFTASVDGLTAAQNAKLLTPAQHASIDKIYVEPGLTALEAAYADLASGNSTKLSQDLALLEGYTAGLAASNQAAAATTTTTTTKP